MADETYWLYLLRPGRAGLVDSPTEEEQRIVGIHFQYLKDATEAGRALLVGRTTEGDESLGICVFKAKDEADARTFMENDPSVKHGVQKATLHPFRLALVGKLGDVD